MENVTVNTGFDTLRASERLRAAGMHDKEAKAVIDCIQDANLAWSSNLATKADVTEIRADIKILSSQIGTVQKLIGFQFAVLFGIVLKLFEII